MNNPTKHGLLIYGVLLLSTIACVSTSKMGELEVDEPVILEAHDEVDYIWTVNVEPGVEYVLIVESDEYDKASYYGFMYVLDEGIYPNEDGANLISRGDSFTPSVSFVAPADGTVTVVISMINWINTEIEVTLTEHTN